MAGGERWLVTLAREFIVATRRGPVRLRVRLRIWQRRPARDLPPA